MNADWVHGLAIFWGAFLGSMMAAMLRGLWHRHRARRKGYARFLPDAPNTCPCACIDCRNDHHANCPLYCRGTR